jgi:hypothetical protein
VTTQEAQRACMERVARSMEQETGAGKMETDATPSVVQTVTPHDAPQSPDNYFARCLLTWESDARCTKQRETWDECVHKPSDRFTWTTTPHADKQHVSWTLAGTLPTIGPDGQGTI